MLDFQRLYSEGHEQVVFFSDPSCNLRAIVAIHDTTLGPALGGTRMWPYSSMDEAVTDVLRLSKGMTYKAAVSGLNLGGGKAVIVGDPEKDKSEALLRSYGRFIESLNGRYITAEDVNIGVEDIEHIFTETDHVDRRGGGARGVGQSLAFHRPRGLSGHRSGLFQGLWRSQGWMERW